jgi:hypothetical protein
MEAYKGAEKAEQDNHLREAHDLLRGCAKRKCGAFLYQQCGQRWVKLGKEIPSVVLAATDQGGKSLIDVQVTVDNEPFAQRLDGRPLQVDPGSHEFAFKGDKGTASQKVVIGRGDHNRPITASLKSGGQKAVSSADVFEAPVLPEPPRAAEPAKETQDEPPPSRSVASSDEPPRHGEASGRSSGGPGPYLLGGLGLAGLGGYALLTYWGRKDNDALVECKPLCAVETTHHIRQLYMAADISAAVGAAALIGSTTWLVMRSRSSSKERASNRSSYVLDVRPTPSGAVATVAGAF